MKILLLVPMPPSRVAAGAIPVLLYAQLVGLAKRHDVSVVTLAGPDPAELHAVDELRREGWEVHCVARHFGGGIRRWKRRFRLLGSWLHGRDPWRTIWFADPTLQPLLDELLRTRQFDVVAVEDNSMATYHLVTDAATVLTEHEVRRPRPISWAPRSPRNWASWAFKEADWHRWPSYQRRVWGRFDVLRVFTERDAEGVASLAPDLKARIRVSPFGIDFANRPDRTWRDDASLLFVGNFTHHPNVDAALWLLQEIVPLIVAEVPNVHVRLAGIAAPPQLRALASPAAEVIGFVRDIDELIQRSGILVAPIRSGGGMRMKVLHAMALGKPVVTTHRGADGLGAPCIETLVVVPEDAAAVASAIVTLLRNPEARRDLGRRALSAVSEHHSPDACAQALEEIYSAAIDSRRRNSNPRP